MEQIRISAKSIGELALADFCPRCFWTKLHSNFKLPFQIFPGIFSSIDAYTKKITNLHYEAHKKVPAWFSSLGQLGEPVKVPHHSEFRTIDGASNVLLTGMPDEMFKADDGSYFIVDYKTAKFTETQDTLLPMYEVQLNVYAYIAEKIGMSPVRGLALLYYEPFTDIGPDEVDSLVSDKGFLMKFNGHIRPIDMKPNMIAPLLKQVREIYDMPNPPRGTAGCKNCQLVDGLLSMLSGS